MNVLDEQVPVEQLALLQSWGIKIRHIGHDIGRTGIRDQEILALAS